MDIRNMYLVYIPINMEVENKTYEKLAMIGKFCPTHKAIDLVVLKKRLKM